MSNAFSIAVGGINGAVSRASQAANNIANASLTGSANVDGDLIKVKQASTDVAVNATAIKEIAKEQKALLDIKV